MSESRAERTLAIAERVVLALRAEEIPCAVIGAMALAARGFARHTDDFDLATDTDPFTSLRRVHDRLQEAGLRVELRQPDAMDPLGGVLDVRGSGARLVQVVNFWNPLRGGATSVGREAVRTATDVGSFPCPVVDVPHLVALKLYASGRQAETDILRLLDVNPDISLVAVREVCARFDLAEALDALLAKG